MEFAENTIVYQHIFDIPVNDFSLNFSQEKITLGGITIYGEHLQDCCECVYIDFDNFSHIKIDFPIKKLVIKAVKDCGLLFFFYKEHYIIEKRISVLCPCYNEQSGQYSDELILVIQEGEKITKIDIRETLQDCEY